ncbi:hypothetical protein FQN53_008477 [Emmonsiellopsis sp. PD_33]|nr:hypothetical protein FQN53_008477 [Emmonsiellopsis sp. PD_33]
MHDGTYQPPYAFNRKTRVAQLIGVGSASVVPKVQPSLVLRCTRCVIHRVPQTIKRRCSLSPGDDPSSPTKKHRANEKPEEDNDYKQAIRKLYALPKHKGE